MSRRALPRHGGIGEAHASGMRLDHALDDRQADPVAA